MFALGVLKFGDPPLFILSATFTRCRLLGSSHIESPLLSLCGSPAPGNSSLSHPAILATQPTKPPPTRSPQQAHAHPHKRFKDLHDACQHSDASCACLTLFSSREASLTSPTSPPPTSLARAAHNQALAPRTFAGNNATSMLDSPNNLSSQAWPA